MNDVGRYHEVFSGIVPYEGEVPAGFSVDFLGGLTDLRARGVFGNEPGADRQRYVRSRLPTLPDAGEGWFEALNWVEAAREAKDHYVMFTLGACYGAQAVGAYLALQRIQPMPAKLCAVEPEPENVEWLRGHFTDNGLDADDHWIVPLALSDQREPVFFPVGAAGSGAQNCYSTNEKAARENYVKQLLAGEGSTSKGWRRRRRPSGEAAEEALRRLILENRTALRKQLVPGEELWAEIRLASSLTLPDLLGPFDFIDYIEADMQQSEILVFPPHIPLLTKKVRRVHIGTHGGDVHDTLHRLFSEAGWEIIFSFAPNSDFDTELGRFSTNDGVLTVRNPKF
ncbi:MAG: hypothetical protein ACYCZV_14315 [Acidimicrobiales bacterium]